MTDETGITKTRSELVHRRFIKTGWLCVAAGVVIPVLAFVGVYRGWHLLRVGNRREGLPLFVTGAVIFVVRLALWARTGFTSAY
jgi:hypothetical protein